MNLKFRLGQIIKISTSQYKPKLVEDKRKISKLKVMYFCGENGVDYLNKSLLSIYKSWETIPEILIMTDGSDPELMQKKIINWPKKVEIIKWNVAADYFKKRGNEQLYNYANNELWGRKFISVLYSAAKYKTLYSDTDVLWYREPHIECNNSNTSNMMMGLDIEHCYDENLISLLQLEKMYSQKPVNAGVIYATGDFSSHPKWFKLCEYLENNNKKHSNNRHEQTSLAILNNYFGSEWNESEIFLKVDDINELYPKIYKKDYKSITARHYVNTKPWLFWRDYMLYFFKQ